MGVYERLDPVGCGTRGKIWNPLFASFMMLHIHIHTMVLGPRADSPTFSQEMNDRYVSLPSDHKLFVLIPRGYMTQLQCSLTKSLIDKEAIYLHMFCPIVLNWVFCNINCWLVPQASNVLSLAPSGQIKFFFSLKPTVLYTPPQQLITTGARTVAWLGQWV